MNGSSDFAKKSITIFSIPISKMQFIIKIVLGDMEHKINFSVLLVNLVFMESMELLRRVKVTFKDVCRMVIVILLFNILSKMPK
jgi:hypothetical protein